MKEVGGRNERVRREGDDLDDDFVPDEGDEDYYGLGKGATADESDDEASVEEPVDEDEMEEQGRRRTKTKTKKWTMTLILHSTLRTKKTMP